MTPILLVIGRAYCPFCDRVAGVVKHPEAEIHCPRCGTRCEDAAGPDDRRPIGDRKRNQ